MKAITKYQCEICNKDYLDAEEANNCESGGKEIPLAKTGDNVVLNVIACNPDGSPDSYWIDTVLYEVRDTGHSIIYDLGTTYDDAENDIEGYYPCETVFGNEYFKRFCKVDESR